VALSATVKTWLITGCSTGFGRYLATAVLEQGDRAVVTARNPETVSELAAAHGDRALALPLDVTKAEQIAQAVATTEDTFGGIDVLVNNAGYGLLCAVEEASDEQVRAIFDTNFFGLAALTRAVLPGMRGRRSGTIVNISSFSAYKAYAGIAYYSASKFAVEGFSEALWQEVEPLGLKVIVVSPAAFRTNLSEDTRPGRIGPANPIAEYDATAGALRQYVEDFFLKEPGDPVRAVRAIIEAVESDHPPHRLLLGNQAYDGMIAKLEELRAEVTALESVTRGADYPPDEA
jgi:NAD(P)-dependent dehydrogenase (short-subunit alcohol dehydrogenase family)